MLAVSQLQARDLAGDHAAAGVGEERRHPVPVDVGEGELRARMGAFLAQDQPRPFRPRRQVDHAGGLGDPGAVAQPLVFDRRVPALAGIRSTMAWMRSSTGNPKENSTLPCGRPRRTGAWPRRSRSGPAPAASRGHPAAAGRALAAAPAPSSAPSRGQWRCYCPRCRPAAGRPAPPRPRPPAGPKRPAAGGPNVFFQVAAAFCSSSVGDADRGVEVDPQLTTALRRRARLPGALAGRRPRRPHPRQVRRVDPVQQPFRAQPPDQLG